MLLLKWKSFIAASDMGKKNIAIMYMRMICEMLCKYFHVLHIHICSRISHEGIM